MPKSQTKYSSIGFLASLIVHAVIASLVFWGYQKKTVEDDANAAAGEMSTSISMEMMMATVLPEPESEPEPESTPEPTPEPKPELQEEKEQIADPTIKPEPPKKQEKKIVPEKLKEKPKEKQKEKQKEKPKEKEMVKQPPKEKPKEKRKEKPKEQSREKTADITTNERNINPRRDLPIGNREIVAANGNINSKAAGAAGTANNASMNKGGGSGNSSSANAGNADEMGAYRNALRREIERHKRYTARARMMKKQGTVTIAFNLSADGSISGARIASSSGSEDLDNSALDAVQSARSIGARPAGFPASLSVPISFTLR